MNLLELGIGFGAIALVACTTTVDNDDGPTTSNTSTTTATGSGSVTSTSAASGGSGGNGGGHEGGAQSETCQTMQAVTITNPVLEDAGLDGTWSPGETASITVTLTSPQDTFEYPGIIASHTSSALTPPSTENWLFGLIANEPTPVNVVFTAAPQVPPNTMVDIVVEVGALNQTCAGTQSVTVSAVID